MSSENTLNHDLSSGPRAHLERPKPAGAPHVLAIVLDDTGFGQLGCFGSTIDTPNIDALAAEGLRFNRFHVTAMCSPTRAAFFTGRNAHHVGMGFVADVPLDHPGYTARIPKEAATVARVLKDAGWATRAIGKWHLVPRYERSDAGPFESWPLGLGFERFYGFLQGDTSQWRPNLVEDNHYVERSEWPDDYHLSDDLVDRAIRDLLSLRQAAPEKPTFAYLAMGAMHAPHHVAPEWVERYRGKFDEGWDRWRDRVIDRQRELGIIPAGAKATPRPEWVEAWDALSEEERSMHARQQEVFAGFLSHTDHQIGRLLDALRVRGILDDTIVMLFSDNGASAEGGRHGSLNEHRFTARVKESVTDNLAVLDEWGSPETYNHYSWGWAWAGNAPFQLWKRFTWLGGTRTPLIVRYPRAIKDPGAVRTQLVHVIDLAPTILELAGVELPHEVDGVSQLAFDGTSIAEVLANPKAADPRSTQYFELLGSRSIIHDGFKATTNHVPEGLLDEEELLTGSRAFATDHWSLYDLSTDFAEVNDLSAEMPERVEGMEAVWLAEAQRNHVLPLFDTLTSRFQSLIGPRWPAGQHVHYEPAAGPLFDEVLPLLFGGFLMTAHVEAGVGEGVLAALGDRHGGFSLVIVDGHLEFTLSDAAEITTLRSPAQVPKDATRLSVAHVAGADGSLTLLIDDHPVVSQSHHATIPVAFQHGGAHLRLGYDVEYPVSASYEAPFRLDGTIVELEINASPAAVASIDELIRTALHSD